MKKLLISMMLAICVVAGVTHFSTEVQAVEVVASGTCGSDLTWGLDSEGTLTISGSGAMAFSNSYNGCAPWNVHREAIKTVLISDGVTKINRFAFYGCNNLESMTIPFVGDSRKTAKDEYQYPFGYIFGTASYDGAITVEASYVGFINKTMGVEQHVTAKFYVPASLRSVTVTGGEILYDAFFRCANITHITVPKDITQIGRYAFGRCTNLQSVTLPEQVTQLSDGAFYMCQSLETIMLPDGLQVIGDNAFHGCTSLQNIAIPDSVTRIGNSAFCECCQLKTVTVGSGLTNFNGQFIGCYALTGIWVDESNASFSSDDSGVLFSKDKTVLFSVPGSIGTAYTVPEGVTKIVSHAFGNCKEIVSLTIPFVGESAASLYPLGYLFDSGGLDDTRQDYYVNGTKKIMYSILPDTLAYVTVTGDGIGYGAFQNCSDLVGITLGDGVKKVGEKAFMACTGLKAVTISEGVTNISACAFKNCTTLPVCFYRGTAEQKASIWLDYYDSVTNVSWFHGGNWHYEVTDAVVMDTECYYCPKCDRYFLPDGSRVYSPGDLDRNDVVNEYDVIYLLRHVLLPESFLVGQAVDYDKSGKVDEEDVVYLLQYILMPEIFSL